MIWLPDLTLSSAVEASQLFSLFDDLHRGFEQAGLQQANPAGAPWTFAGNSGLTGNASGFTGSNPNAPEGCQVAFVQTTGSMSQPMTFASSFYKLAGCDRLSLLPSQKLASFCDS